MSDLGATQKYLPLVTKSFRATEKEFGVDAVRVCEFMPDQNNPENLTAVAETVLEWKEEEMYLVSAKPIGGSWPFDAVLGRFVVTENENNSSKLRMDMEITVKSDVRIDENVIEKQFKQLVMMVLDGISKYFELGRPLNSEEKKQIIMNVGAS